MFSSAHVLRGLVDTGIDRHRAFEIIEVIKQHSLHDTPEIKLLFNDLAVKAFRFGIVPNEGDLLTEQQACKLLDVSSAYFRVTRKNGGLIPTATEMGEPKRYFYTLYNLAEYQFYKNQFRKS